MKKIKIVFLSADIVEKNIERAEAFVGDERRERANKLVVQNDRLLSLGAGYLIKRFVGDYYIDENGKPRSDKTFFNVSHSGRLVGIALSIEAEVGLDLELSAEKNEKTAKYVLSESEFEAFKLGTPFSTLFVAKESLAKAQGEGVRRDIKTIPALPLSGCVVYGGESYFRRGFERGDYCVSVTAKGEDFLVEIEQLFALPL